MPNPVTQALFETHAFRVSPADQPFWYTSGLFGPYYINTHFLLGGELQAKELLSKIEAAARGDRRAFTRSIAAETATAYENIAVYRDVIDALCRRAVKFDFDFVSGGERRDFFFSLETARRLDKPHLAIFKDGACYYGEQLEMEAAAMAPGRLKGKKALHVADLITEASSYQRAWLPALDLCGASLPATLAVVDRCQGGVERLQGAGVHVETLTAISPTMFHEAKVARLISGAQEAQLSAYYENPHAYVKTFLAEHPDFLEREAAKDERIAERVRRFRSLSL